MSDSHLTIGCFGKVAGHDEHLSESVVLPTARAFKEWAYEGRRHAGDGESTELDVATSLLVLVTNPGAADVLAGLIRPSGDSVGRGFPFAVFTHFPRRPFHRRSHLLPLAVGNVWSELDSAWAALSSMATLGSFRETLSSYRVSAPASPEDARAAFESGLGESARRLFEGGGDATRLDAGLPELVARLRRSGADAGGLRVELPVADALDQATFDTAFWIQLIEKQFMFRRPEPSVFLDEQRAASGRRVFLKFGALRPEDYKDFMGIGSATSEVLRPAGERARPASAGADPGTFEQLLRRRFAARGGSSADAGSGTQGEAVE